MPGRSLALFCLLLAAALVGCSKSAAPILPPIKYGNATITGRVRFVGTPPAMHMIPNRPCHAGAAPYPEETVVVGNDGGLANVFISLQGVPAGDGSVLPQATLDQKDCRFVPHAVAVAVGQSLLIRSDDPTMHNVTYAPSNNPPANYSMIEAGMTAKTSFVAPEYIRVRCDIHPWMNAWIGVFDNPFFAVSDPLGQFKIDRVPAGEYTLIAWQEQYGKVSQPITVPADGTVTVDISFPPPVPAAK